MCMYTIHRYIRTSVMNYFPVCVCVLCAVCVCVCVCHVSRVLLVNLLRGVGELP